MLLLYINDLSCLNFYSKFLLYADDLVLYCHDSEWRNVKIKLEKDLAILFKWTLANRLTINFAESKFQNFLNKNQLAKAHDQNSLTIGDLSFERVETLVILGLFLTH